MPRHLPSQAARQKGVSKVVWKFLSVRDKSLSVPSSVKLCLFVGVSFALSSIIVPALTFLAAGRRKDKGFLQSWQNRGRTTTKPTRAFFSSWPDLSCFGADLAIACQKIKDPTKQPPLIFFNFLTNVVKDFEDFKRFCKWMLRD